MYTDNDGFTTAHMTHKDAHLIHLTERAKHART